MGCDLVLLGLLLIIIWLACFSSRDLLIWICLLGVCIWCNVVFCCLFMSPFWFDLVFCVLCVYICYVCCLFLVVGLMGCGSSLLGLLCCVLFFDFVFGFEF